MSILDSLDLDGLAAKAGLDPEQVRTGGEAMVRRLGGGDPPDAAARHASVETGVPLAGLQALLPQLRASLGEGDWQGALGQAKTFLDKDGDGNPLDDLTDMAKGLFGRR